MPLWPRSATCDFSDRNGSRTSLCCLTKPTIQYRRHLRQVYPNIYIFLPPKGNHINVPAYPKTPGLSDHDKRQPPEGSLWPLRPFAPSGTVQTQYERPISLPLLTLSRTNVTTAISPLFSPTKKTLYSEIVVMTDRERRYELSGKMYYLSAQSGSCWAPSHIWRGWISWVNQGELYHVLSTNLCHGYIFPQDCNYQHSNAYR